MATQDRQAATDELRERVQELVTQLQAEQAATIPADEPYLASDSGLKRGAKRGVFRVTRHATRRYDRLATELAMVAVELADQLQAANADIDRIRGDIDRLDRVVGSLRTAPGDVVAGAASSGDEPAAVPDAYYWAFEARMRGTSASVLDRLRRYESFAVPLRDALREPTDPDAEPPIWLDLGCGLGEFCELVREWGWRVEGVDSSPAAVDACRTKGVEATLADATDFLATRRGETPGAISAIQVIEHLPRDAWIGLFERAHAALAPGGALLVETINGLNPEAVTAYFVADVTHTWPGHPETLTLMAEHAGFARVEVVFCNPDGRGNAQDFAIWATKVPAPSDGAGDGPSDASS